MRIIKTYKYGLLALVLLLAACGRPDATQGNTDTPSLGSVQPSSLTTPLPTSSAVGASTVSTNSVSIGGTESYNIVRSFKEAVQASRIIVIGEVTGVGAIFNTHRDAYDPSKSATDSFGVGQEYLFHVERYLKGSDATDITIVQVEGAIFAPVDQVTPARIEQAKAASGNIALETGQRYLLFLKGPFDYLGKHYYSAVAEPWKFRLDTAGRATIETPGEVRQSLPENFIPDPNAPFVPQIEQIIQNQQAGKP